MVCSRRAAGTPTSAVAAERSSRGDASRHSTPAVAATGQQSAGQRIGEVHPGLRSLADLTLARTSPDAVADAELVFLALPHGASGSFAEALPDATKIVDLGADHRLVDPAAYEQYYG